MMWVKVITAIENYKEGKMSIGRAAETAGISIGELMNILAEFGIEGRIEHEDYLKALENLKKVW